MGAQRDGVAPTARRLLIALDATIADLHATRKHITEAVVRAHRDSDAGFAAGSDVTVSGSRTVDNATAERAVRNIHHPDDIAHTEQKMIDAIGGAHGMAQLARRSAEKLLPLPLDRADSILRAEMASGTALCANPNCQRVVLCTAHDRLLGGRCRPCHDYLSHSRKTDRLPEERPAELCGPH